VEVRIAAVVVATLNLDPPLLLTQALYVLLLIAVLRLAVLLLQSCGLFLCHTLLPIQIVAVLRQALLLLTHQPLLLLRRQTRARLALRVVLRPLVRLRLLLLRLLLLPVVLRLSPVLFLCLLRLLLFLLLLVCLPLLTLLRLCAGRYLETARHHGSDTNRRERPIHDTCCHGTPPDCQCRPITDRRLCC
jgi:hypothetical protein